MPLWRYCALLRLLRAAAAIGMLCACLQDMQPLLPQVVPEHNFECKGALERPRLYRDGGCRNAAAVQSFTVHFAPMHTRTALHGSREHCWLQWAVSGRNLTRKGPLDAQERDLSGGVRWAAVVRSPAE